MKPKDQELMERYIYQVVRRLPKEQRNEVGLELQELISDMSETSDSMEAVLTKLGDPAEFAKRYQDSGHHLIGPEYYDNYLWVLKIVMTCALVPILIVGVIEGVEKGVGLAAEGTIHAVVTAIVYGIMNCLANAIVSEVGAFGSVTLIFAIMERRNVKFDMKEQKQWTVNDLGDNFEAKSTKNIWSPKHLSPIPHKKAMISRGDSIIGIVFIIIFCILLIFAPHFFAAVFKNGEVITTIPVFNLERWNIILPLLVLGFAVSLADEIFRLVKGHYCKPVMISNITCGFVQMVITVIVLKVLPFWNPNFSAELKVQLGEQSTRASRFLEHWGSNAISDWFLIIILLITLAEIGATVYKTLRYASRKRGLRITTVNSNIGYENAPSRQCCFDGAFVLNLQFQ